MRRRPQKMSSARGMRALASATSLVSTTSTAAQKALSKTPIPSEVLGPNSDAYKLWKRLPSEGALGNISLRRALGWTDGKYERAQERLLASGLAARSPGRGGALRRVWPQGTPVDAQPKLEQAAAAAQAATPIVVPVERLVVKGSRSVTKRTYRPQAGSGLAAAEARWVGDAVEDLLDTGRASISPADLVTAARSAKSPLHKLFEWDDKKAAEAHRLGRAQYLLRSVVVEILPIGTPTVIRPTITAPPGAQALPAAGRGEAERGPARQIDYQEVRAKAAIRELDAWAVKYSEFARRKQFKPVFEAIKRARG